MKFIIGCVLIVFIAFIAYHVGRFLTLKNVGERLAADTKPFQSHPPHPTKHILMLGDSLAVGVGAHMPENSIAGRIAKDNPTWDITNMAVSGSKIQDVLELVKTLQGTHYDTVIIQIGGNDVVQLTSVAQATHNLAELFTISKTLGDKVVFFSSGSVGFSPIFPQLFDWFYTHRSKVLYAALQKTAAEANVSKIDLYVDRKDDIFQTDIDAYYAYDYFHVADAGYGVWYAKIKPSL